MKNVYLIGNAHIDPVWLWTRSEGMSEIMASFRSALDRMNEFPSYIFTSACASYYEWVEKVDASMFSEIQRRVSEGRWVITGGFWVQPDCNIPSGEAFVRHALYSQRYFKEKFGVTADVGYNVDSFGHNGMLPQILKKAGMSRYVFMRPDESESTTGSNIPQDLFVWESPDGSEVLAARICFGYNDQFAIPKEEHPPGMEPAAAKALFMQKHAAQKGYPYFSFYGIGNHGGGPTIRGLKALEEVVAEHPGIIYASPKDLFNDIAERDTVKNLPHLQADLQHHASGCYSANSAIKQANRRAENELVAAEILDTMANILTSSEFGGKKLKCAWEKVMFNQFHDILAGCSIKPACTEALNAFGSARDIAAEHIELAAQRISWNIGTTRILDGGVSQKTGWVLWEKEGEGSPVVVFNPHSFPVETMVQININAIGLSDEDGVPVPCQSVRGYQTNSYDKMNTIFPAKIPAFGYTSYYIYKEPAPVDSAAFLNAGPDFLENDFLRVEFSRNANGITSFYDKRAGELAGGIVSRAVVIEDEPSDTWAHAVFSFDNEVGCFECTDLRLLEDGPLRATLQMTSVYKDSTLVQNFMLYAGEHELKAECTLDFHEKHKIVKLSFPINSKSCKAIYSMPYGFIEKECDGKEEPGQEWTAVIAADTRHGLALTNDSKYSFSVKDNDLRMTVARSAIYADHYGERDDRVEYLDQGRMDFAYSLLAHNQNEPSDTVKSATLLNRSPHIVFETHHTGKLPSRLGGIEISADNVICKVLKPAEDGNGYIARFFECAGIKTEVEVNLTLLGCKIAFNINPQEIKTLLIQPNSTTFHEVALTEWEL